MFHALSFTVVALLFHVKSEGLGTEISDQLAETKLHCRDSKDLGYIYDSLGTDSENTVSSISTTTINSDLITDTISGLTDGLSAFQSSAVGYQPLQQELLIKLNNIKSIVQNAKAELDILVDFAAESTPGIITQITAFEATADTANTKISNAITAGFTGLTATFNSKLQAITDGLEVRFNEPKGLLIDIIDVDLPNYVSSLSSFPSDTETGFNDATSILTSEFIKSTNNINDKADDFTTLITEDFGSSTNNINQQSGSTTDDVDNDFKLLNDQIGDDTQKDLESAIIALTQTIKSARDNMKWSLGLKIDYGFSAKTQGLHFDGSGLGNDGDSVLIELSQTDVYIIATVGILMNLVWILMIVYLFVDYCMPKYKNVK